MTAPAIFTLNDVRAVMTMDLAIAAVRQAFVAAANGDVESPFPWHLDVRPAGGEVHVKGAALARSPIFAVKTSTGFPRNVERGRPTSGGFTSVFDAETGALSALLLDDGYLTELRTGAAGAVALDALAHPHVETVAVIGTGGQAHYQIEAIQAVRAPTEIVVVGRRHDAAASLASWASERTNATVTASTSIEESVRRADAVVTVTAARTPIVDAGWPRRGVHISALGADSPGKRELDPRILTSAALVAVDDIEQSRRLGELQGVLDTHRTGRLVPLGAILIGSEPGRRDQDETTVADLSGLGAQDAAIAEIAWNALVPST